MSRTHQQCTNVKEKTKQAPVMTYMRSPRSVRVREQDGRLDTIRYLDAGVQISPKGLLLILHGACTHVIEHVEIRLM